MSDSSDTTGSDYSEDDYGDEDVHEDNVEEWTDFEDDHEEDEDIRIYGSAFLLYMCYSSGSHQRPSYCQEVSSQHQAVWLHIGVQIQWKM